MHSLESSAAIATNGPALAARMADDGYLYLPGLLPAGVVAEVQRQVADIARDAGWLRREAPLADAVADPAGFCVDTEPGYLEVLRRINRLEAYAPIFPHPRVLMRNIFPAQ